MGDDAQARNYVISANIHRRHLSPDQRREIIAALLKADPTQSNRQVAEQTKTSHHTVGDVRTALEATGQIAQLDKTTGADGKKRTAKGKAKGKGKASGTSDKEKVEYQKPIDTKTAISACRVLTEHLKDVLEDLSEFSSVDHAEVLAEQVKGEIDKTILHMRPAHEETEEEAEQISAQPHPRRRQYEGIDLVPDGPAVLSGNIFNLWRGWGVEPKKGDWSLLRRHVYEVLANGDQKFDDYIIRWGAWTFQHAGERTGAALVLRGGKGSGKGVWGDVFMTIFGEHGLQIFDPTHLTGKHNAHLQNKLFLFADEAFWAGDKTAERTLKGVVTEKRMMIEPKGINAFPWPNRMSLYMAANEKWVVPASHDERRYAVGNVNERWKKNWSYFQPLLAEIAAGAPAAMLYDLERMKLGDWDPMNNVPQTQALLEQKMFSLDGLEQWWVSLLDAGELPYPDKKNPRRVNSRFLLEAAQKFSPRNRYVNETELGTFLGKMGCKHKSNGRNWGWVFPPLHEARTNWSQRSGGWEFLEPELEDWGAKPDEGVAP